MIQSMLDLMNKTKPHIRRHGSFFTKKSTPSEVVQGIEPVKPESIPSKGKKTLSQKPSRGPKPEANP